MTSLLTQGCKGAETQFRGECSPPVEDPDGPRPRLASWSVSTGIHSYDNIGNLTFVNYPASTDITLKYNALDRLTNMVDAAGTTTFTYYAGGLLNTDDGPWSSDTLTYTYNSRMRASLTSQQPEGSWVQNYYYDRAHRLWTNTSPAGTFAHAYQGAGKLVKKLILPNSAYITNWKETK